MKKIYTILFSFLFSLAVIAQNGTFTEGTFILNEDWFGHDNGSINYLTKEGEMLYRVYRQVNNGETFGTTSQYGAIYGNKLFVVSKQASKKGGSLVVADAKTLKKTVSIEKIGADGRAFVGVDENTAYISTLKGIYLLDIKDMEIKGIIKGSNEGFYTHVGNMIRTSKYVFAIRQGDGVLVIDPVSHSIIKTIPGSYNRVAQSKDGNVWVGATSELKRINPYSLEVEETIALPEGSKIQGTWGAWNAGGFCASINENALYWTNDSAFSGGSTITKYDIDLKNFTVDFFKIPATGQKFYGAGLRIDPRTDQLFMTTTESGSGSHFMKNWIYIADNKGALLNTYQLEDYYWFQTLPIFPDYRLPVVADTFPRELKIEEELILDLKKEVNLSGTVVKKVSAIDNENIIQAFIDKEDNLIITPITKGMATIKIEFNLEGRITTKEIKIKTFSFEEEVVTIPPQEYELKMYPNPFSDYFMLETQKEDKVIIYSINGTKVLEQNLQKGENRIEVSHLTSGIYLIKTKQKTYKVIKK